MILTFHLVWLIITINQSMILHESSFRTCRLKRFSLLFSDPEAVGEEGQVSVRRDELRPPSDSAQNGHAPEEALRGRGLGLNGHAPEAEGAELQHVWTGMKTVLK